MLLQDSSNVVMHFTVGRDSGNPRGHQLHRADCSDYFAPRPPLPSSSLLVVLCHIDYLLDVELVSLGNEFIGEDL